MNGIRKATGSSTAVVGLSSLAIYVAASKLGVDIPWELVASVVGGYAVKEGARSFAPQVQPKPTGKK